MGLWDTFKSALGLNPGFVVREPGPFAISESAALALQALPEGKVLHVQTREVDDGRLVSADVGDEEPGLESVGERVRIPAPDVEHLTGLELDAVDGRFRVTTHLELRGRETPNPDSRVYLASRPLIAEGARFYQTAEHAPLLAQQLLDSPLVASVLFRLNTLSIVRTPESDWSAVDAHVDSTLRHYLLRCGKAIVPVQRTDEENSDLENRVLAILEERVRPRIHQDGGDLELLGVENGVVKVHMVGACSGCPASSLTLKFGIEQVLKELLPGEIEAVEQVG
ncbi:MAG: NifU family protein [Proteobacteria bacterium]|nr:NifU family protein [Pseudomonadota bacterium]